MLCNSKKTQNQSSSSHETSNQSQNTIELAKNISISIFVAQTPGTTPTRLHQLKFEKMN